MSALGAGRSAQGGVSVDAECGVRSAEDHVAGSNDRSMVASFPIRVALLHNTYTP